MAFAPPERKDANIKSCFTRLFVRDLEGIDIVV